METDSHGGIGVAGRRGFRHPQQCAAACLTPPISGIIYVIKVPRLRHLPPVSTSFYVEIHLLRGPNVRVRHGGASARRRFRQREPCSKRCRST